LRGEAPVLPPVRGSAAAHGPAGAGGRRPCEVERHRAALARSGDQRGPFDRGRGLLDQAARNPKARFVFVGTPWADPAKFDLVITTPQYGLPKAPNILHNALPLHGVTPERLASEAARWEARLAHLPRPRIAVLVGGSSGPLSVPARGCRKAGPRGKPDRRGKRCRPSGDDECAHPGARCRCAGEIHHGAIVFLSLGEGRRRQSVPRLPRHGEASIVTGDSISMLSEASAAGKPVFLFDIEDGPQSMRAEEDRGSTARIGWRGRSLDTTAFRLLMRHAPTRWSRDLRIVHRHLVEHGLASWLGEKPNEPPFPVWGRACLDCRSHPPAFWPMSGSRSA
jgi:uncharacterized protein